MPGSNELPRQHNTGLGHTSAIRATPAGTDCINAAAAALRAGAHDYLLKPCSLPDLLSSIAAAVRQRKIARRHAEALRIILQSLACLCDENNNALYQMKAPPAAPTTTPKQRSGFVRVGRLVIDTFRHSVLFDNKPIHATPIEYALLSCLAKDQGRVLTYSEIVRRTHGYTVGEDEAQRLIKAHVRNLRRKIQPDYLTNARGAGYMLSTSEADG